MEQLGLFPKAENQLANFTGKEGQFPFCIRGKGNRRTVVENLIQTEGQIRDSPIPLCRYRQEESSA